MVKNLNHRVERIEQILPTLATKEDLQAFATKKDLEAFATKKDLEALRKEMKTLFQDATRHALVLHEDLKSQIGLVAEHLADVMSRLPPHRP